MGPAVEQMAVARAVAQWLVPALVEEVGPRACVRTSSLLTATLSYFGFSSEALAVTAILLPAGVVKSDLDSRGLFRPPGRVYSLGSYSSDFRPVHGPDTMSGCDIAGHVVVVSRDPDTLYDLTAQQLNTLGAEVPSFVALPTDRSFPVPNPRLTGRLPDGRLLVYDWAATDQSRIKYPPPSPEQLGRMARVIRDFM